MVTVRQVVLAGALLSAAVLGAQGIRQKPPESRKEAWVEAMQAVHAKFTGQQGTFAHFGDSITVTQAFWTPMLYGRKNAPPDFERDFQAVKAYLRPECWRDWKGPEYGSEGGKTSQWAQEHVGEWLKRLNPEVALVMFGSNDLGAMEVDEYRTRLREVVQKCLDNGTVVLLSTIPPRHGFEEKSAAFAAAAREIAKELKTPLTDYYAEIVRRRPKDWNGALDKFSAYTDYEVPTLIARDGVHPSFPKAYQDDFSPEALSRCGYGLRSYLTLRRYAGVLRGLGRIAPAPEDSKEAQADAVLPVPEKPNNALKMPAQPWFPKAPPLPPPAGEILRVADVEALQAAVEKVKPGGTILIADGLYRLPRPIEIKTDNVTLRSASGQRDKVVLDGGNEGELVKITACTDVTIADLTVQNVRWNGIKINSETGVHRARIYNCVLHNIWQRFVKGVIVPEQDRERLRPTGCRVEYCLFYNDHAKRFEDDFADTAQNFNGNYVGGIDIMYARNWTISDNVFVGIRGRTGEARGAVFIWNDSQGCVVERNIILDCDSGICLGNSSKDAKTRVHATRCIVRNNFLTRVPENGLLADYTQDCLIANNTVYDPGSRLGRLLRLVHDNTGLVVANNLLCGPDFRVESESKITFRANLVKDLTASLTAPKEGNLRLKVAAAEVVDKGARLPEVTEDIDRKPRNGTPDIGAHEF